MIRSKKRREARRLLKYAMDSGMFSRGEVNKVSGTYLVTMYIKGDAYSYVVDLEALKNVEEERNKMFAKFIADSVMRSVLNRRVFKNGKEKSLN